MSLHPDIAAVLAGDSEGCIVCADSMVLMSDMPDDSASLVFADPPYNIGKAAWDKVPDYLAWCETWIAECSRVLKPNGAFWISHSKPLVLAKLSEMVSAHGKGMRNWVTWDKSPWSYVDKIYKEAGTRAFIDANEYLVYHADEGEWTSQCDKERGFIFEPLRAYLEGERKRAGIDKADCNVACGFSHSAGGMASRHYFSRSQWCLPTVEHYESMRRLFNENAPEPEPAFHAYHPYGVWYPHIPPAGCKYLRREYEDLRREYEGLRYTFNNPGKMSSVWQIPPAKTNGHPTPKPEELLKRIIEATSNPGDLVVDPFCGSGTTAAVADRLGRRYATADLSERYCEIARSRVRDTPRPLFTEAQQPQPDATLFPAENKSSEGA